MNIINQKRAWYRRFFFLSFRKKNRFQKQSSSFWKNKSNLPVRTKVAQQRYLLGRKRRLLRRLLLIIILLIIFLFVAFIMLYLLNNVWRLRSGKSLPLWQKITSTFQSQDHNVGGSTSENIEYIKGILDVQIPKYPHSSFVFENMDVLDSKQKEQVARFLEKNTVYVLDPGYKITDVYDYYKKILPSMRWTFVQERPETDGYLVAGVYFVRENLGLRIFTLTGKDIWYELLPASLAEEGLESRMLAVKQQVFSVSIKRGPVLPKLAGWQINIPDGYAFDVSRDMYTGGVFIEIKDKDNNQFLSIMPVVLLEKPSTYALKVRTINFLKQRFPRGIELHTECKDVKLPGILGYCKVLVDLNKDSADPVRYLFLSFLTEDKIIYVFDFGEVTDKKLFYMLYLLKEAVYVHPGVDNGDLNE